MKRAPTALQAGPAQAGGPVVVVYSLRTVRPYRKSMWHAVSGELDRKAHTLAARLGGRLTSSSTGTVAGTRARQYLFEYGAKRARIAFLFRERREYELYCSWKASDGEPAACGLLLTSFRLA